MNATTLLQANEAESEKDILAETKRRGSKGALLEAKTRRKREKRCLPHLGFKIGLISKHHEHFF